MTSSRVLLFGEGALLVELARGSAPTPVVDARRARVLARSIDRLRASGAPLGVPVAGAASVLVPFDPLGTDSEAVEALVRPLLDLAVAADPGPEAGRTEHELGVRYGGEDGPDLASVAAETGMAVGEVVRLHATATYEVLFLGFAPGFAYLGELAPAIVVPRLATPRTRVPANSVAIAGPMTAVYPRASAGGWRLIGRADADLFDPARDPPSRLHPGDLVRFVPLGPVP